MLKNQILSYLNCCMCTLFLIIVIIYHSFSTFSSNLTYQFFLLFKFHFTTFFNHLISFHLQILFHFHHYLRLEEFVFMVQFYYIIYSIEIYSSFPYCYCCNCKSTHVPHSPNGSIPKEGY